MSEIIQGSSGKTPVEVPKHDSEERLPPPSDLATKESCGRGRR